MAINITFTDDDTGVIFTVTGSVTGNDILEAHKEAIGTDHFHSQKYWIVDRTHCTEFLATSNEMELISSIDNDAAKINPNLLVAIISVTDLQFGMSRVYDAYISDEGFKTNIFKDYNSAMEWIESILIKT